MALPRFYHNLAYCSLYLKTLFLCAKAGCISAIRPRNVSEKRIWLDFLDAKGFSCRKFWLEMPLSLELSGQFRLSASLATLHRTSFTPISSIARMHLGLANPPTPPGSLQHSKTPRTANLSKFCPGDCFELGVIFKGITVSTARIT